MRINEVSEKCNITKRAIKYYEEKHLIKIKKDENGYRCYTTDDVKRLKEINCYRKLDIEIQKIKEILEYPERKHQILSQIYEEKQKEQLATILVNQHLFHMKTKKFISVLRDRKKDCLSLLETFHAHCVHQLRNLMIDFTKEYRNFRSQEFIDNYIYQIVATVPSCLNGMRQTEKPVDILIVSTDSKMQESLLIELLRFSIRGNYVIHQINMNQLHNKSYLEVFEEHDIVVSTSTFDVPHCLTPIIAVELCPSIQSLNKIQQLVDQIISKRQLLNKHKKKMDSSNLLESILPPVFVL